MTPMNICKGLFERNAFDDSIAIVQKYYFIAKSIFII